MLSTLLLWMKIEGFAAGPTPAQAPEAGLPEEANGREPRAMQAEECLEGTEDLAPCGRS